MKKRLWMAGTALMTPAIGFAQTGGTAGGGPPAAGGGVTPATAQAATPAAEILVVAETGDRQAIDRKSYTVRQGPAAAAATAIDAFRDLPSVSVDAAGRIELLGNAGVRILIDGRPVPDAVSVLRSLNASQIQRIEVITNPSAQFSAEGTAGIINVITRRSSRDGLGGSIAAGEDSRGGGLLRAAPTWTQGRWSLSTSPTLFGQNGNTRSELARERLAGAPDGISDRDERGAGRQQSEGFASRTQLVFRADPKRSLSAALSTSAADFTTEARNAVSARAGTFAAFEQRTDGNGGYRAGNLVVDYRAEGDQAGELLTASLSGNHHVYFYKADFRERLLSGGTSSLLTTAARTQDRQGTAKLDYATPLSATRRLTVGGSLDWRQRALFDRSAGSSLLGLARDQTSRFGGEYVEGAGYASLQVMVGKTKFLPGLRVQARGYSIDGLDGEGPSRIDPFPSLFVERALSRRLTGVVSYSRRISWPDIADLSPNLRFQSPTFAVQGDPGVRPETTDAVEARLGYAGNLHSLDLTLYDRTTHDSFDRQIAFDALGVVVSRPINAGQRIEQGLEAGLRGRLLPSLRYSLTGNATAVTREVGTIGNRRRDAQYRGKLQLDYTQGKATDPGFDQLTLNLRYEGPVRLFQYRREDYVDADLGWTHRFTPRLSLVSSVTALLGAVTFRSETRNERLRERRRDEGVGRTLRMTLTYQLSANQQQPQLQPPAIPPVPTP